MKKTILISAGGTGGHVFPALAVAKLLRNQYNIVWVGAPKGIENTLVPQQNILLETINIAGLRKKGFLRLLSMPFLLFVAFFQALSIILRHRPQVIVGFGGYATFPICCMSWVLRLPVIIHEQNSIAGLTNKVLAKLATKVLVAFNDVLASRKTIVVGNPVREEIVNLKDPIARYANRVGKLNILVLGGSLGAQVLNDIMPQVLAKANNVNMVIHQVGRGDKKQVESQYQKLNIKAQVVNFIEQIDQVYAQIDLLICRAGALTISEVCAAGIAAILIPYPYAADDHQRYNAQPLVAIKAAYMLLQSKLTVDSLVELLNKLDRSSCLNMANRARSLAIPDSSTRICNAIIQTITK